MKSSFLMIFALLFGSSAAYAADFGDYAKEMGTLGSGVSKNIDKPEQYTPRYDANPAMAEQYYGGGMMLPTQYGDDKIARCKNDPANPDLYLRQECEGVNFIVNNPDKKPNVTVSSSEKLVSGTQTIAGDPAETLEKYKWKYPVNADGSIGSVPSTACPTETVNVPAVVRMKSCSEYTGAEMYLCEATLKVNVDPHFNYSCLETKYQNATHACSKKLQVTCEPAQDCTAAGVQAGTLSSDMQVTFAKLPGESVHTLTFGTAGDDYWHNGQFDRELSVNVKNLKGLNQFKLTRVEYDDWLVVQVNGHIVFSSYGNEMLKADFSNAPRLFGSPYYPWTPVYTESGVQVGEAERKTSWKQDLDVDIRPYLVEGKNVIKTRTIAGGGGESYQVFKVNQYCEPVCVDTWQDECTALEQRVAK